MAIPRFDADSRRLAHEVVDALFDHVQGVADRPVVEWKAAGELRELVRIDRSGAGSGRSAGELVERIARYAIQLHHPSYMGHQVCPPFSTAVLADLVISTLNQSTAVWEMSPIATVIEKEVVRWLADRAGYPEGAEGTAVSGGSAANLTALMAARARWRSEESNAGKAPLLIASADAHYSVARAAAIMGIPASGVLKVPTDSAHRMDVDALEELLAAIELRDDASVLAIVATSGSTAAGAFDRLDEIALLRDRYRLWLHVDAAHGASVLFSDALRPLVRGLERADSFAWDPHKMLWMPLSLGIVLVRDGLWLRGAFEADAPYLFHQKDGADRDADNIGQMTIQCSKRADAIKLWLTVQLHGTAPFAEALDRVTATTRYLYERVRESDDFEPMHEPDFNIFCWRYRGDDATNARLREELLRSGEAWITSTVLKGQRVLRVTVINPATGPAEIDALLATLRRLV
jgi:L-2,4-diaminobutyrate decarboxylase